MKKNIRSILLFLPVLFFVYMGIQLFVPVNIGDTQVEVEIPEGTTFKQALTILSNQNLIRDKNLLMIIGKLSGVDKKIRAGYYAFWNNMTPYQAYKRLTMGKIIEYEITVLEGDTLREIGEKLANNRIVTLDDFNSLANDEDFLKQLNIDAPSIEGYLYPQTYKFPKGAKPEAVIKFMVTMLRQGYPKEFIIQREAMGWTENEILTLASIIEREAATDSERPIISAVFHNRLKKGMPLQADPTAIYGIKRYNEKITREDLRRKSIYNTYIIKGLPPGPIASPSKKSIKAALFPAAAPYLYFVSNGDGTHTFSVDLSDHTAAIKHNVLVAQKRSNSAESGESVKKVKKNE